MSKCGARCCDWWFWRVFLLGILFGLGAPWPVVLAGDGLRPLTTDRPDLTESPFTVNAGHVQIESTFVGYGQRRRDRDGVEERSFEFATTNVRVGLTQNSEINLAWQPYGVVRQSQVGRRTERNTGIGAIEIRAKFNVFGNDQFEAVGDTALAVLPFVTLPTDDNNGIGVEEVEGGIIVPFAVVLGGKFGLGVNAGLFFVRDDAADTDTNGFVSAALSYEWTERFGTYYEIAATFGTNAPDGDPVVLGTGFTYALADATQLDGGVNFGITDAAERWAPFVGITRRF